MFTKQVIKKSVSSMDFSPVDEKLLSCTNMAQQQPQIGFFIILPTSASMMANAKSLGRSQ